MSLRLGWKAGETWESHWPEDDAFTEIPPAAMAAWGEDGDGSHLRPFIKPGKEPTRIAFRTLTPDEAQLVRAIMNPDQWATEQEAIERSVLLCFRIGVTFPGLKATFLDAGGAEHPRMVKERGVRMLANEFVSALQGCYPGIVSVYGSHIMRATFATEPEKKASSQPSTPTPSAAPTASPEKAA